MLEKERQRDERGDRGVEEGDAGGLKKVEYVRIGDKRERERV